MTKTDIRQFNRRCAPLTSINSARVPERQELSGFSPLEKESLQQLYILTS